MEISSTVSGSSDGSNPKSSSLVSRVRKLLFRKMLVGIKDGRFFLGTFHCIDKQGNIILQDAVEYRSTRRSSPSPMEQRCLGLILIPSSCRTSCHVDCSIEEQLSLLKVQEQVAVLRPIAFCFKWVHLLVSYSKVKQNQHIQNLEIEFVFNDLMIEQLQLLIEFSIVCILCFIIFLLDTMEIL